MGNKTLIWGAIFIPIGLMVFAAFLLLNKKGILVEKETSSSKKQNFAAKLHQDTKKENRYNFFF